MAQPTLPLPPPSRPTLNGVPTEVRLHIYRFLLISDDLANISTVWDNNAGASARYHLSPAILRTCSKFYAEAADVLYRENTFAIDCIGNEFDELGPVFLSPLTRFALGRFPTDHFQWNGRYKLEDGYKRIRKILGLPRILRWKVIVEDAVSSIRPHQHHSAISAFCKAVCRTPLSFLEIYMHCKDCAVEELAEHTISVWSTPDSGEWEGENTASYFEILEPLQMLRNVQTLEFKCRKCNGKLRLLTKREENFIQAVVKGSSPPDLLFEQYERLLEYCRTFERWGPFRRKMGNDPIYITGRTINRQTFNPYQHNDDNPHPVESHLLRARKATNYNERELFRSERKIILEYLEPQYQRLSRMMDKLVDAVKEEKVEGGVLGENSSGDLSQLQKVKFHLLLEDVAAAFTRDVPPGIRALMRVYHLIFDQTYPKLQRERWLKDMNASLDVDDHIQQRPSRLNAQTREDSHRRWQNLVRAAGADMDKQWLEIRKARRGLFQFDRDRESGKYEIDVEEWRYDEAIDWNAMEPWIGPLESDNLPFFYDEAWGVGGWVDPITESN